MKNKYFLTVIAVIVLVALFLVQPAFAQGEVVDGVKLTVIQFALVSFLASIFTSLSIMIVEFFASVKVKTPNWLKEALVYVWSFIITFSIYPPTLPVMPSFTGDILSDMPIFINNYVVPLFTVLSGYFVIARAFYLWLLKREQGRLGKSLGIKGY